MRQTQSLEPTCRRGDGFATGFERDGDVIRGQAVPFGKIVKLAPSLLEQFHRGTFSRQMRDPARVKLCLEHGQVVGKCTHLEETDDGLQFEAVISKSDGIPEARRARALLDEELIDELSIGFSGVDGGMDVQRRSDGSTLVTHRRANLKEISLVPWGVYGRDATLARSVLIDPQELARQADVEAKRAEARAWVQRFATVRS